MENTALIVTRADGVPLYSVNDYGPWDANSVGALVGGMWQAAETVIKFIPDAAEDEFRLNFDSSSRGVYILKVDGDFEPLFICLMYFDIVNPAKIKTKLKTVQSQLAFFIENNIFIAYTFKILINK